MRILIVGARDDRARLRSQIGEAMEIAGEFATLAAARRSSIPVDAIVLGADPGPPFDDERGTTFEEPPTPRERQVLARLAEGLSNKAIAAELGISDQTVKFHVASIFGKLGAANRTEAVRKALRRGLIDV